MKKEEEKSLLNNLLNKGVFYINNKNPELAIKTLSKILVYRKNNPKVLNLIGIAYHQKDNLKEAQRYVKKAIKYNPKEIGFYINLGNILKDMKNFQSSFIAYKDALNINNKSIEAIYNIGVLFTVQRQYEKASKYYKKVIQIDSNHKYSFDNLGKANLELANFDEAILCYKKAISIDPNFFQSHFNLSLVLLLKKIYKIGWEKYEYRLKKDDYKKNRSFLKNQYWKGSKLDNKILLIYCEQGIGDSIQFARYIKKIKKNNTKIILLCNEILKYFFNNFIEIDKIITNNKQIPKIDYCVSLMSLPCIFREDKIPRVYRFFGINIKNYQYWESKLSKINKIKVGLTWQGDPIHASDYKRSISLKELKPIIKLPNICFISLQKDFGREQIKSNKFEKFIVDFFDNINSFQDTVSIIENLDLVITVDTAIAHISLTMGKETWVLLPFVPDFRWGLENKTSIWYSKSRLFRQKNLNQWDKTILEVRKELIKKYNKSKKNDFQF